MAHPRRAKKREARVGARASSLLGTAEGTGRFGGAVHRVRVVQILFACGGLYAVTPAQPPAQVDQLAAPATKRPLRPILPGPTVHRLIAYRAAYLTHR